MNVSQAEWRLYICRACGLIYNEQDGDPDSGLAAGTRFDDIPDDWECPLCGVTKSDFEPFEKPVVNASAAVFNSKNTSTPNIFIVGAGIAGWSMAEEIRKHDTQTPVTMICACSGDVYHKPELSVAIGRGISEKKLIREKGIAAASRLGINLMSHTFVVGLSAKRQSLRTTRGSFSYQKLILAQGAKTEIPNGIPAELCWRINHFSAWQGLKEKLSGEAQTIAIIGAGMVGCELAENLSIAGHKVTLIFRGTTPLARLLPPIAAQRVTEILEEQGIDCIAKNSVTQTRALKTENRDDKSSSTLFEIDLSNGETIRVNQIVTATGLKIDERIPQMAGLQCNNGIVVDNSTLKTDQDDIYALGDCISLAGESCRFVSPILQQAKVIAAQIRGEKEFTYHHEQPAIRLKVQACSLVVEGRPVANAPWKTVRVNEDKLYLEQWRLGQCVSKIEFIKAS